MTDNPNGPARGCVNGGFIASLLWALIALAIIAMCGGCTTARVPPTRVVTSTRDVLVRVPCFTQDQAKGFQDAEPPHVGSQTNGQAAHDLMIVAPNAMDLRTWGEKMLAGIVGCAADQAAS